MKLELGNEGRIIDPNIGRFENNLNAFFVNLSFSQQY